MRLDGLTVYGKVCYKKMYPYKYTVKALFTIIPVGIIFGLLGGTMAGLACFITLLCYVELLEINEKLGK